MDEYMENQALLDEEVEEDGGQGEVVGAQENPDNDGQEGVVAPQEAPQEGEEGQGETKEEEPRPQEEERLFQSRQDNAAAKAARLRAEQDLRRQYDETVAGLGIPNPYTGKPFQSFEEFKAYGEEYRKSQLTNRAKQQGKTVEELLAEEEDRAFLRRKRQEEQALRQAREKQSQRQAFMMEDLQSFVEKHPEVDIAKLESNPKFLLFAGNRLYKEPLGTLYEGFTKLVSDTERAAVAKAAGKSARSTGSGQGGSGGALTPGQRAQLEEWNRENPNMKMTAKEFLEM